MSLYIKICPRLKFSKKSSAPCSQTDKFGYRMGETGPWFNRDDDGFALGVHEDLVKSGTNPLETPEKYYRQLDAELHKRFPDKFDGGETEDAPAIKLATV